MRPDLKPRSEKVEVEWKIRSYQAHLFGEAVIVRNIEAKSYNRICKPKRSWKWKNEKLLKAAASLIVARYLQAIQAHIKARLSQA